MHTHHCIGGLTEKIKQGLLSSDVDGVSAQGFLLFLSLVSHTMGSTPGLARAWRCGLDGMSMTGLLQSTDLPKMRDTISLFTGADLGMGVSN